MPSRKNITLGITINLDNYENLRLEVSGEAEDAAGVEELIAFLDTLLLRLGRGDAVTAERVESYRRRVILRPGIPGGPATARARVEPVREKPAMQATARPPPLPSPPRAAAEPAVSQPGPAPAAARAEEATAARGRERPPKGGVLGVQLPPSPLDEIIAASEAAAATRKPGETQSRALTMADVVHLEEEAEKEDAAPQPPAARGAREVPPAARAAGREGAARARKQPPPPPSGTGRAPEPSHEAEPAAAIEPEAAAESVLCQECGAPVGKSQQKLSQLFMGRVLCRKCMNP